MHPGESKYAFHTEVHTDQTFPLILEREVCQDLRCWALQIGLTVVLQKEHDKFFAKPYEGGSRDASAVIELDGGVIVAKRSQTCEYFDRSSVAEKTDRVRTSIELISEIVFHSSK